MKRIIILFLLTSILHASYAWAEILETEAGSIYFVAHGKGAQAVVFLHGGFGDLRMWNDQVEEFAKDYRVIRYDQPGFGKSSKPEAAYSPAAVLLQLMDHLGIIRASLVGNSMGGTLAIDFTLLHPERVASIAIVGSGPGGYPIPKEDQEKMNAIFQAEIPEAIKIWLANPMVAVAMSKPDTKELLSKMVNDNSGIFRMKYWPIEKMNPPAVQRLKDIQAPTLVVIGDQDTPLVKEIANTAATGIPGAKKVVLTGTDHLPQMEKAAEFNKIVLTFLSETTLPKDNR